MKKIIKTFSLILVLFICFGALDIAFALPDGYFAYGDFECRLINNETEVELVKYTGSAAELTVPSVINGLTVTSIGERCFYGHSEIKKIFNNATTKHFGDYAFTGTAWLNEHPDTFVVINGVLIEYKGTNTDNITLPKSVTVIGYGAFDYCDFQKINLHPGLTDILDSAFYGCAKLTELNIPASVKHIGKSVFIRCTSLEALTVDAESEYYTDEDNVIFSKDMKTLVVCAPGKLFDYTVPDSVTSIEPTAFASCSNLSGITLPEGVTVISDNAFYLCSNLRTLTFKGDITHIGEWAFTYCDELTEIEFPDSLKSIGYAAFLNCKSLNGVTLSDKVESIANHSLGFIQDSASYAAKKAGFTIHINNSEDVRFIDTAAYKYAKANGFAFTIENEPEYEKGDINGNGKIEIADARLTLRAAVGIDKLTPMQFIAADLNDDLRISISEARKILRVAVNIENSL